ncbi:MAG: hypothetical protein PUP93_02140 [Rhizonema sp. NSF051]|nr:hypothetical protein [Rhizonema sp. NSF051]MDF5725010.1 hypothetical protein [Rhizonema sp. PD37]
MSVLSKLSMFIWQIKKSPAAKRDIATPALAIANSGLGLSVLEIYALCVY